MRYTVLFSLLAISAAVHAAEGVPFSTLAFEANRGQAPAEHLFLASSRQFTLGLGASGAVVRTPKDTIRMRLEGAQKSPAPEGLEPLPGTVNYLTGNRPSNWRTGISRYARVRYRQIYPGVDMVFYGVQGQLEFDLVLAPGADLSRIRLRFEGVARISIDGSGGLVLGDGELRLRKPSVYQERRGERRVLAGAYRLLPRGQVGFHVPSHDPAAPLVIDPVLVFSSYLGGSMQENGKAGSDMKSAAVATDPDGNVYIAGNTVSPDLQTGNTVGSTTGTTADILVAKFSPAGGLVYSTRIGGSGLERGFGIAVDSGGNAYVTGRTQSLDFPVVNPYQQGYGGAEDAFVLKLNPAGNALVYSTYLGGMDVDFGCGIAVDSSGSAYVVGDATSPNFPVTVNGYQRQYKGGSGDAFVAKFGPSGSVLLYSTYLGGTGFDHGESIAVDSGERVYLTGYTTSPDFPKAFPLQTSLNGAMDAFLTKLGQDFFGLAYSTYLGGGGIEGGAFVAVDASGNAYVAGLTTSADFPATAGALQTTFGGEQDGFVAKVSADGSALAFSTLLGGTKADSVSGIALAADGSSYLVGTTRSPEFRSVFPMQPTHSGNDEVFVAKLNSTGSALAQSSFLGGGGWDLGYAIALDKSGNVYVTGRTNSVDFPAVVPHQANLKGEYDVFVARISETSPTPVLTSVSAAAYAQGGRLAPGSIASGFGSGLAAGSAEAAGLPLPATLQGASVTVRDSAGAERPAGLFYVSPGQINYQIPEGIAAGAVSVTVNRAGFPAVPGTMQVAEVAPGLFTANQSGGGPPAAEAIHVAQGGAQTALPVVTPGCLPPNCAAVPIDLGAETSQVILVLYGTGIRGRTSLEAVTARIGGEDAEVQFAGAQGQYVGLDQVNLKIPRSLAGRGLVDVELKVDGRAANRVSVHIK